MKPLLVFAVSKDILGQDGEAKMLLELSEIHTVLYELLNKREVKIAGYCIAKFFFRVKVHVHAKNNECLFFFVSQRHFDFLNHETKTYSCTCQILTMYMWNV